MLWAPVPIGMILSSRLACLYHGRYVAGVQAFKLFPRLALDDRCTMDALLADDAMMMMMMMMMMLSVADPGPWSLCQV
jgi:hypothetical protein